MGTRFELILPEQERRRDLKAIGEAALAEIEDCHRRLSRFDRASLVSYIVRSGPEHPVPLDEDTYTLFQDALAVWRLSEGAFDLTVPSSTMDALVLDPETRSIRLTRPGVALDLGGIAKGHALDLAGRELRIHRVESAFLHGGTSSALAIGRPPDAEWWRVGLAGGGEVQLRDSALSVSAVWEGNPHPTVDPRSGQPLEGPRRAVVTGPTARLADAWSTAALVTGGRPAKAPAEWNITVKEDLNK